MKKFRLLLLMAMVVSTVILCCSISAFALTDGDWEFQLLDSEVQITKYLGDDTELVIPQTIYGAPVTQIKAYGIMSSEVKKNLVSVTVPNTVKVISDATFEGCGKLETVILSEGLETIGKYAFRGCTSLESIRLPETLKVIEVSAFQGCTSLKDINFPASLEAINASHAWPPFEDTAIEHIDLSRTAATLGESAFMNCKKLKTVKLNENTKKISKYMFSGCESLESIDMPAGLTLIEGYAFMGCKSLKSIILPVSLTKIDEFSAFKDCDSLEEVVIPYGTRDIASYTFSGCDNLKSVYIPDTAKNIGFYITENCPNAIIYCGQDSTAAKVCKEQKISYLTDNSVNSGITVLYNGTRISFHAYGQNPELIESRTLVPLRSIFEAMGSDVEWNEATNTAIATRDDVKVEIQIGASEIYKNGSSIPTDVPARLINDRTMVPARVIAEAFGADVQWNDSGRTVLIEE